MDITIRDGNRYYVGSLTPRQYALWDNGAMVSCGLTVGHDFKTASLETLRKQNRLREINAEDYKHYGCQSSCVKRGQTVCRW